MQRSHNICILIASWLLFSSSVHAQNIGGAADISRIKPESNIPKMDYNRISPEITVETPTQSIPKSAQHIKFVLREVHIKGSSILHESELKPLYESYLNQEVTAERAWLIANSITKLYHDRGYFLSRAYLPEQKIKNGVIHIKVIEGYVQEVELDHEWQNRIIDSHISDLKQQQPIQLKSLESFLLRINDLPGLQFRAILMPIKDGSARHGGVKLVLQPSKEPGIVNIGFDNYGSKYLGPQQASITLQQSFLPMNQTTLAGLNSIPFKRLHSALLQHEMALCKDLTLSAMGSVAYGKPGDDLRAYDIKSRSTTLGLGLKYQLVRQRNNSLAFKLLLDGKNVHTNLIDQPFTRDKIRALRAEMLWENSDGIAGINTADLILSQGINGLGSSKKHSPYLSRTGAKPSFTKGELTLSRTQIVNQNFALFLSAYGQYSPDTLYSAEEFGYGGQAFGRAYDNSEITGDSGISGVAEFRFISWQKQEDYNFTPYIFYDAGKVWTHRNDTFRGDKSGSAAGFGSYINLKYDIKGNVGIAFPISHKINKPIYGGSRKAPRILLQISKNF